MNRTIKTKIHKCVSLISRNIFDESLVRDIVAYGKDKWVELNDYTGGLIIEEFNKTKDFNVLQNSPIAKLVKLETLIKWGKCTEEVIKEKYGLEIK